MANGCNHLRTNFDAAAARMQAVVRDQNRSCFNSKIPDVVLVTGAAKLVAAVPHHRTAENDFARCFRRLDLLNQIESGTDLTR